MAVARRDNGLTSPRIFACKADQSKQGSTVASLPVEATMLTALAINFVGARYYSRWVAVVVEWQHADPQGESQRLRALLAAKDFTVRPVRLGP